MNARIVTEKPAELEVDALAVVVASPKEGDSIPVELDEWTAGLATELLDSGEFKAKAGETALVHRPSGLAASRLMLVGVGDASDSDADNQANQERRSVYFCLTTAFGRELIDVD